MIKAITVVIKIVPSVFTIKISKSLKKEKYSVTRSNGKRHAVSSIPSMQKMLNKDYEKQKMALKSILSPTNFAYMDLLLR